jgi:hypothetical protein
MAVHLRHMGDDTRRDGPEVAASFILTHNLIFPIVLAGKSDFPFFPLIMIRTCPLCNN